MSGLSRRQLTVGLLGLAALRTMTPALGVALPLLAPRPARGGAAPAIPDVALSRTFDVFWGKDAIGSHRIEVTPTGGAGDRDVVVEIDLLIDLGWFGEVTYVHSSREIWRGGRIIRLESHTDDDGDVYSVSGRAAGDGFEVSGPRGLVKAPGNLMTSNGTWSESICGQNRIIDATGGAVVDLVAKLEDGTGHEADGSTGRVRAYQVTCPMIAGSFWYDAAGLWMRSRLVRSGYKIDYVLAG